jgi:hypothetical protein
MSVENGNGKRRSGPRRQGAEAAPALRAFGEIPKVKKESGNERISITADDPTYADIRKRFERNKIPLELMDYMLGFKAFPRGTSLSNEESRIVRLAHENADKIRYALNQNAKAHAKRLETDEDFAAQWRAIGDAWAAQNKESLGVSIPISAQEERRTKDLSPIPTTVLERIKQHPSLVNYTIAMFLRQMRDWPFENEHQRAFARYFAETLDTKAFKENKTDTRRSQFENAYWSLLDLKVAEEAGGSSALRPEIRIHPDEIAKHIADFLETEHIRRDVLPTLAEEEREKLRIELAARPTNLIRAFGSRLDLKPSDLPIEMTEIQAELDEADAARAESKESKRLPGDLRFLSRLLGKLHASALQESENAKRDIGLLQKFLDDGAWTEAAQTGFDIINRSVSGALQTIEKMKEAARAAQSHASMSTLYAPVFEKHVRNTDAAERALHKAQSDLIALWIKHSPEGRKLARGAEAVAEAESEAADHLKALATLRDKLRKIQDNLAAQNVESSIPNALEFLDEYIADDTQ